MNNPRQSAHSDVWCRPRPDMQPQLFGEPVEAVLASTHVSRDDLQRWAERGWISFDVGELDELQSPLIWEIEFVRSLARRVPSEAFRQEGLGSLEPT